MARFLCLPWSSRTPAIPLSLQKFWRLRVCFRGAEMMVSGSPNGSQPTSQPAKKYGITKPISVAGPTGYLQRKYRIIKKYLLIGSGLYESKEEAARREEALGRINQ